MAFYTINCTILTQLSMVEEKWYFTVKYTEHDARTALAVCVSESSVKKDTNGIMVYRKVWHRRAVSESDIVWESILLYLA